MQLFKKGFPLLILITFAGGLVLAACAPTQAPAVQSPPDTAPSAAAGDAGPPPESQPPAVDAPVQTDQPEPQPTATDAQQTQTDPQPEEVAPPPLGFEPGDRQLKASDPSGVVLASGEVQLLEFFAFW